jgi:hypothetical protein
MKVDPTFIDFALDPRREPKATASRPEVERR